MLENADLFLDGVPGKEAVGDDLVLLADAVGAVDGLILDGGVPPWIVEDDVGGGGEIEAGTTCFEGKHEDGGVFGGLEAFDFAFAVLGLAGEVIVGTVLEFEAGLDEVQHGDELRKDKDLVAFFVKLIEQIEERLHFRGFFLEILRIDEAGVTANLPQAHETLKDGEGVFLHGFIGIEA